MQSRHKIYAAVTFEASFRFTVVIHAASCPAVSMFSRKMEQTQFERSVAHTYGATTYYSPRYLIELMLLFRGNLAGYGLPDGDG